MIALKYMKTTVKDVINQLEKRDPNDTVFALIYTKDDVKELEHYDPKTNTIVFLGTNNSPFAATTWDRVKEFYVR